VLSRKEKDERRGEKTLKDYLERVTKDKLVKKKIQIL
jgi:hypothetical protein